MTDILSLLENRERPRLLMQAARLATREYSRERHLTRLLRATPLPGSCEAALRLMSLEESCEAARRSGDGTYSVARHVELMSALICEARTILEQRLPVSKGLPGAHLRCAAPSRDPSLASSAAGA